MTRDRFRVVIDGRDSAYSDRSFIGAQLVASRIASHHDGYLGERITITDTMARIGQPCEWRWDGPSKGWTITRTKLKAAS